MLYQNRFGKCIAGKYFGVLEKSEDIVNQVHFTQISAQVMPEYFAIEALGVDFNPKCGSCACGKCPPGGGGGGEHDYSLKEERELALIKRGLKLEGNVWVAEYPWTKEANELPNNRPLAVETLIAAEKRLSKDVELAESYKAQMDEMVGRGASRKLTTKEIKDYKGPVHYVSHHEVSNPNSKTTPCRIVF